MPGCPRKKGLPKKIAFSILGTPPNLKDRKLLGKKRLIINFCMKILRE